MSQDATTEAQSRIRAAKESGAKELSLVWLSLEVLPPEIGQLTQLQSLDLSGNQLTALPAEIVQLTQLQSLDLSGNQLTALPAEIVQLTQLQSLALRNNQPPLTALSAEIVQLTQLQSLVLRDNQLTALPAEIVQLTQLQSLDLGGNQLTALPAEIVQLRQLQSLDLSYNQLTALPAEIVQLTQLQSLDLGGNQLTTLPAEIGQLTRLQSLALQYNQLLALPAEIGQLRALRQLDLFQNQLEALPPELARLELLEFLELRGNPKLGLPLELVEKPDRPGPILRHLRELQSQEERQPLNEAKVLLVGEGNVGKTSLADRLLDFTRKADPSKTEGVDIRLWPLNVAGRIVRLNVWDFGGQEIYHATHQFFLTARSLYLLVIHARQGEKLSRLDYWLRMIESHGGDSPVIVVLNQSDQHRLDLDRKGYAEKYLRSLPDGTKGSRIVAFVETACKGEIVGETHSDRSGLARLRDAITEALADLPHVGDLLSDRQFRIKRELEALEQDHITHEEFCRMCTAAGLTEREQHEDLARLFHDLGLALHYNDPGHPLVQDTNILNPEWVTEGIYRILSSHRLFTSKGLLQVEELSEVLRERPLVARSKQGLFARLLKTLGSLRTENIYPAGKHNFLLGMMEKFELCFPLDGASGQAFLIPGLLGKEEPDTGFSREEGLRFEYHYPVLPESVMSRFIVRTYQHISQRTYWRGGVVLATDGCRALIRADTEGCKVFIQVKGSDGPRRGVLTFIRKHFEHIHSTLPGLKPRQCVPVPGVDCDPVDYETLLTHEREGLDRIIPVRASRPVPVRDLLDGVDTITQREERRRQMEKSSSKYDIGGMNLHAEKIDVHIGDRQGLSVDDVLKLVRGLKEDLRAMPVAPEAKSRAATALTKAESEMDFPAKGGEPDKAIVKKSLEEAAGILKGANATAEQLSGFVEKAKKIADWIGAGAGWAMALFGS